MAKQFGFCRSERLKSRKMIDDLFRTGKSFAMPPLRVSYKIVPTDSIPPVQAGVTVSKRHFKRAVDRNRIKRLMREAYRLEKNALHQPLANSGKRLLVFFIYTDNVIQSFESVRTVMQQSLQRLEKILNQQNAGAA